ncbi:MAG: hypothetical protein ABIH23_23440 [bacterium]
MRLKILFFLFLFFRLLAPDLQACGNLTVRDAAFQQPRDIHRLCVIDEKDGAEGQRIYDRIDAWLKTSGAGLNIELYRESIDDPKVQWDKYGIPSAPPSAPVVVLAGYHRWENRRFFIHYWEPGPSLEELESLRTSPARETIRNETPRKLAMIVYVPGTVGDSSAMEDLLSRVAVSWSKEESLGVSVIRLDRLDKREQLLYSFMGIEESGPDWVAIAFGRGKITPPLQGDAITESDLNARLDLLVGDCTCLQSPSGLGVDIPMVWDETFDSQVIALRSDDDTTGPTSEPALLANASGVLGSLIWTVVALALLVSVASIVIMLRRNP